MVGCPSCRGGTRPRPGRHRTLRGRFGRGVLPPEDIDNIPAEVLEAARRDGASAPRIAWSIKVPAVGRALVTIFLFQFVEIWNNYLLPAMVLGDDRLQPVTVGLVGWNAGHVAVPPPLVVVGSLVSVVPLLIAFLALQRFWRAGMTAGALK